MVSVWATLCVLSQLFLYFLTPDNHWYSWVISMISFPSWGREKEENHQGSSSCNNNVHLKWPVLEIAWMGVEKLVSFCWRNAINQSSKCLWRHQPPKKQDWFPLSPLSSADAFNQFPFDAVQSFSVNMVFASHLHTERSLWYLHLPLVLQLRVFNQITVSDLLEHIHPCGRPSSNQCLCWTYHKTLSH